MTDVVARLPERLRAELKTPAGALHTDAETLLGAAGGPLFTVGDVVTHHVIRAGETPDVALVDDRTERSEVDATVARTIAEFDGFDREQSAPNPAGALSAELLSALVAAVERAPEESALLVVDGEEDLAALPAIAVAPAGASVVYGQPGEGMVLVTVDGEVRAEMTDLLSRMDGDTERLRAILEGG
jgi:uncharacterized protein (UPF0218 family)